jgi:hypothetical protein
MYRCPDWCGIGWRLVRTIKFYLVKRLFPKYGVGLSTGRDALTVARRTGYSETLPVLERGV